MARQDDRTPIPPSDEERRMIRYLDNALVYTWKSSGQGRTLSFSSRFPLYEFFDLMMRMSDAGYALAASLFGRKVAEGNVERAVRSRLMTMLACGLMETNGEGRTVITESMVAHFGRFVNVLIADMPELHVEWAEDMDADDPMHDQRPEPIAVIRGVLLAPSLDQRRCVRFWELAAKSSRFPCRIFSEPCPPDDGAIFSSYHRRAFAIVFTAAPDDAVERFAKHMREHARHKLVRRWRESADKNTPQMGKWMIETETATENERLSVFRGIAGGIESNARRRKVSELFGLEAEA